MRNRLFLLDRIRRKKEISNKVTLTFFKSISSVCLPFSFHLSKITETRGTFCFRKARFIRQNVSLTSLLLSSPPQPPSSSPQFFLPHLLVFCICFNSNGCCNSHPIFVPGRNKVDNWTVFTGAGLLLQHHDRIIVWGHRKLSSPPLSLNFCSGHSTAKWQLWRSASS